MSAKSQQAETKIPQGFTLIDSMDTRVPEGYEAHYQIRTVGSYMPEGATSMHGDALRKTLLEDLTFFPCGLSHMHYADIVFGQENVFLIGDTFEQDSDTSVPKRTVVVSPLLAGEGHIAYHTRGLHEQFTASDKVLLVSFRLKS